MKKLYLIAGRSGCGKTTVCNNLAKELGCKVVNSYTTRPPRYEHEPGHIFVSKDDFDKFDLVAYTKFNGYEYGITADILDNSDLYVIDFAGINVLKNKYHNKPLCLIYLETNKAELKQRMLDRGDSINAVESRLLNDDKSFKAENELQFDYRVDTSGSPVATLNKLKQIITEEENKRT